MKKEFIDDYDDDFYPPKRTSIDIPNLGKGKNVIPTEEQLMEQALLNNVPNNTEIENINHLNELKQVVRNWTPEERKTAIDNLPVIEMLEVISKKYGYMEQFTNNSRANINVLNELNL